MPLSCSRDWTSPRSCSAFKPNPCISSGEVFDDDLDPRQSSQRPSPPSALRRAADGADNAPQLRRRREPGARADAVTWSQIGPSPGLSGSGAPAHVCPVRCTARNAVGGEVAERMSGVEVVIENLTDEMQGLGLNAEQLRGEVQSRHRRAASAS